MTFASGGIVVIDKDEGMTSSAVVSRMRVLLGEKRVGHTGTLDPFATGVLPICFGRATAAAHYMLNWDKRYLCGISLGMTTDTMDRTGTTVERTPETAWRRYASQDRYIQSELEAVTDSFIGKRMQRVPIYSAVKVDGRRLYRYAREGSDVDLPEREITVYEAAFHGLSLEEETGIPIVLVEFLVSSGTYVRALAEEYGQALGCCAHARTLRRLAAGPLTVEQSITLDSLFDVFNALGRDPMRLRQRMTEDGSARSLASVFSGWPRVIFEREDVLDLTYGRRVPVNRGRFVPSISKREEGGHNDLLAFFYGDKLVAFGFVEGQHYRVKRVFLEPDDIRTCEGISYRDGI